MALLHIFRHWCSSLLAYFLHVNISFFVLCGITEISVETLNLLEVQFRNHLRLHREITSNFIGLECRAA